MAIGIQQKYMNLVVDGRINLFDPVTRVLKNTALAHQYFEDFSLQGHRWVVLAIHTNNSHYQQPTNPSRTT